MTISMVVAQISDMHVLEEGRLLFRRVDTATLLARAVEQIVCMTPRPDVVVATGDLVNAGGPGEYRRLRQLLAPLPMPVYLIPGNHDSREKMRAEFADHDYFPRGDGFLHYVVDGFPVRLIALDTIVPGHDGGLMCDERLAWLDARLAEQPGRPTVIFMHHPPFPTGIRRMDGIGLGGADRMGQIVARHPNVERILCGHLHRPIEARWHGTLVRTAPSTAHQVSLDLAEKPEFLMFAMEPPAFLLHVWDEAFGLVTHTSYVGHFPGPYRFREATDA